MQAIETLYHGRRFRSRLEARWAIYFDTLGLRWEYEREGYDLSRLTLPQDDGYFGPHFPTDLGYYLPDFFIYAVGMRTTKSTPQTGLWVEVKGVEPTEEETNKCIALGYVTQVPTLLCVGEPRYEQREDFYQCYPGWDNYMHWMKCYQCGRVKIEFLESNYCYCAACQGGCDEKHPALIHAVEAARGARFEFLEKERACNPLLS